MVNYRKKPVVIQALQIPVPAQSADKEKDKYFLRLGELAMWMAMNCKSHWEMTDDKGIDIHTLEGVMHASPGDYIIRGVQGEFYPCKPDIFEATYERV